MPVAEIGPMVTGLVHGGIAVHEVTTVRKDLEKIFLELIGA